MARKNLLEAFQTVAHQRDQTQTPASGPEGSVSGPDSAVPARAEAEPAAPAKAPASEAAAAGKQAAGAAKQVELAAKPPKQASGPGEFAPPATPLAERAGAWIAPLRSLPVLAALLAVFTIGFLLGGRVGTGGEVAAAKAPGGESSADRGSVGAGSVGAGSVGAVADRGRSGAAGRPEAPAGPALSAEGAAGRAGGAPSAAAPGSESRADARFAALLADPANLFTIQVASYGVGPEDRASALQTAAYLRAQGLDASDPMPRGSRYLVLLVGAAPAAQDLIPLRDRVRALRGPTGRAAEFTDAYVVSLNGFRN